MSSGCVGHSALLYSPYVAFPVLGFGSPRLSQSECAYVYPKGLIMTDRTQHDKHVALVRYFAPCVSHAERLETTIAGQPHPCGGMSLFSFLQVSCV